MRRFLLKRLLPLVLLCAALPAAGCACVLWAGVLIGRPEKKEESE